MGAIVQGAEPHRQVLEAILRKDQDSARAALAWPVRSNRPVLRRLAHGTAPVDGSKGAAGRNPAGSPEGPV